MPQYGTQFHSPIIRPTAEVGSVMLTEKSSSCGLGAVDEENMAGCSLYNFHGLPVNIKDVTYFVPLSRLSAVLATFTNLNVVASLTGARTICSNPGCLQAVLSASPLGTNHPRSNF